MYKIDYLNKVVIIDGKPTRDPESIGLAILNAIDTKDYGEDFESIKERFIQYLKKNQHRVTPERIEMLKEICNLNDAFSTLEIWEIMREKKYLVSRSTCYNTVNLLLTCRILKRCEPDDVYSYNPPGTFVLNHVNS